MEHDLLIVEICVDRFRPRLTVSDIQAAPKSEEEEWIKDGGRIRGRGNKIHREDEKKERGDEMKQRAKRRQVNGRKEDRGEANRAASGVEHQSARSIHAHPSQRGCQGHFCCPLHHNVRNTANIRTL